ncbi:Type II/IV secretion system protein [uncultured archaeon]|nr:Type II/IV secretion system protein [uncultured archaeon]
MSDMAKEARTKEYSLIADDIVAKVRIIDNTALLIGSYELTVPGMDPATAAFYDDLKTDLLNKINITPQEHLDIRLAGELKQKFRELSSRMVKERIPHLTDSQVQFISGSLVQEMLGLGNIEFLLCDNDVEEVCINTSLQPVWVYHKEFGWLKSNVTMSNESQIWNYASSIARRVGRQITIQTPLLDAYLSTGDRVNATILPVSSSGNTITVRKFARKPWTITDFIANNTISIEVSAFLWLAMQYEASILMAGGTAAGKTSLLNVLSSFFPSNQRVVSIEQTREVTLPSYLQWIPLVVREPTTEGKGEINMLDLLVNSLRMRPDRIIVGEIRRAEEAQVLFEAIHTGHSVYATLHAETISEALRRLASPPILLPPVMLESLPLMVTMFRDRRSGIRRVFEVGEVIPSASDSKPPTIRVLFRWDPATDNMVKVGDSTRIYGMLKTFTSMTDKDIEDTLRERGEILEWLVWNKINSVEDVGKVFAQYSRDPESVLRTVRKGTLVRPEEEQAGQLPFDDAK